VSFLDDLVARLADEPVEQHAGIIRSALAEAADLDLVALTADIHSRFNEATVEDGLVNDAAVDSLETLARIADGVQEYTAAVEERAQRIADAQARVQALAPPPSSESAAEPELEPTGPEPVAQPEAPSAEPDVTGASAPAGPYDPQSAATGAELAVSSDRVPTSAPPRVPLGLRSTPPPRQPDAAESGRDSYTLVASADVTGSGGRQVTAGQRLESLRAFGAVWEERLRPLINSRSRDRQQIPVARLIRRSPDEITVLDPTNHDEGSSKIEFVTDESRLEGGSLVAAGGWCAPSLTLYDLTELRITDQGMVDLPTLTATRSGLRYPADFDWAEIWGSVGFHQTEAQAVAGESKSCLEVPCDDDFIECRLDADGLCLRTPILTQRGWPERIARFTEGALAVHSHKMNAWQIARMEELSTPVTLPAPGAPDPQAAIVDLHGPGAVESVLSILEHQVMQQRYRERLAPNATLELTAPLWLRGILKSDLRKKAGIDNRWSISDQQLDAYLRNAGMAPQWVYDWQDAYADGDEAGFGGRLVHTAWPTEVRVLLYPAGTFFRLQSDVISLDGVYDHDGLTHNVFTSLFTEEGVQVCIRGGTSYALTIPLFANGLSGSFQSVTYAAPAPALAA
jgi:hypothetical protein